MNHPITHSLNRYIYKIKSRRVSKFAVQVVRHELSLRPSLPNRPKYRIPTTKANNIILTITGQI